MTVWTSVWRIAQIPFVHHLLLGAVSGLVPAVKSDYEVFTTWRDFHQAATYDWGVASWRWFQGAIMGAVSGLLVGGVIG